MSGRVLDAPRPLAARALGALATGALVALWAGFAPSSVGGDLSYAVVRGDSMRPHLDSGDIVVLRRERQYGIGDVVAYQDPQIGAVLHRVIGKQGERFVIRGDNRDTQDAYTPLPGELVGRVVTAWPQGLPVVLAVTSLRTLLPAACAFVALGLAWQTRAAASTRFRRRRPPRRARPEAEGS